MNLKGCIKLIYDTITHTYCVKNEFDQIFEIQNMGNQAFPKALFGNASFGNGKKDDNNYSLAASNTQHAKMDLSAKLLPRQMTIKTLKIIT